MEVDDAVRELKSLSQQKPLKGASLDRFKELCILLKKEGFDNHSLAKLTDYGLPTIKETLLSWRLIMLISFEKNRPIRSQVNSVICIRVEMTEYEEEADVIVVSDKSRVVIPHSIRRKLGITRLYCHLSFA